MTTRGDAMTEDVLRCTPADLMAAFRAALTALTPSADRLLLQWRDPWESPAWEQLATAVFDAYVRQPIVADAARSRDEHPWRPTTSTSTPTWTSAGSRWLTNPAPGRERWSDSASGASVDQRKGSDAESSRVSSSGFSSRAAEASRAGSCSGRETDAIGAVAPRARNQARATVAGSTCRA